jgi:hypothetical protein
MKAAPQSNTGHRASRIASSHAGGSVFISRPLRRPENDWCGCHNGALLAGCSGGLGNRTLADPANRAPFLNCSAVRAKSHFNHDSLPVSVGPIFCFALAMHPTTATNTRKRPISMISPLSRLGVCRLQQKTGYGVTRSHARKGGDILPCAHIARLTDFLVLSGFTSYAKTVEIRWCSVARFASLSPGAVPSQGPRFTVNG